MLFRNLSLLLLCGLWVAPVAFAHGPGAHLREADRTLELLAEQDGEWAALVDAPMASSYLRLGSIAPDFQWISSELPFGHGKSLSYHLLDVAETPQQKLFALGHLAHILSDANAEMFLTPTVFGSQPLGLLNVFQGQEDLQAESETLCEGFGDLLFGDWVGTIDLLYDFYLEGPEAIERATEILEWYCAEGEALTQRGTRCDVVVDQILTALGTADGILGGSGRSAARQLIGNLVSGSPRSVLDLFATGFLSFLLGSDSTPSRIHDRELARLRETPLITRAFWEIYDDHFLDLAPTWTIDHLRVRSTDWPDWEARGIIAGNIQSMMQAVDEYNVVPGLLVDRIRWLDDQDASLSSIGDDHVGEVTVELRFYSTMPWSGDVHVVVRGDREGLSRESDPEMARTTFALDIEPKEYTERPRDLLTATFTPDAENVQGYYVELYADDLEGPFFTTSVDRFWRTQAFDLYEPIYRTNLRTYGGFPESLRHRDFVPTVGTAMVHVFNAPDGLGFAGAEVTLVEDRTRVLTTGRGGVVALDGLAPGTWEVEVSSDAHEGTARGEVEVVAGELNWIALPMVRRPVVEGPSGWVSSRTCFDYAWDVAAFDGQVSEVAVRLLDAQGVVRVERTRSSTAREICSDAPLEDGTRVQVEVETFPEDDDLRASGRSAFFGVDGSPAEVSVQGVEWAWDDACTTPQSLRVAVLAEDPHAPVERMGWRRARDEGDGAALWTGSAGRVEETLEIPASDLGTLTRVILVTTQASGLETQTEVLISPPSAESCDPSEEEPVEPEPEEPGPVPPPDEGRPGLGADDGCGCATTGGSPAGWLGMLLVLAVLRRRRAVGGSAA